MFVSTSIIQACRAQHDILLEIWSRPTVNTLILQKITAACHVILFLKSVGALGVADIYRQSAIAYHHTDQKEKTELPTQCGVLALSLAEIGGLEDVSREKHNSIDSGKLLGYHDDYRDEEWLPERGFPDQLRQGHLLADLVLLRLLEFNSD